MTEKSKTKLILSVRSSVSNRRKVMNIIWRIINVSVFPLTFRSHGLRRILLRFFGAEIGRGVRISSSCQIEFPHNLKVGSNSSLGKNTYLQCLDALVIGGNVCISDGAILLTGSHDLSSASFKLYTRSVAIDDACWIAYSAMILPGVQMGKESVAGAGSVVFKDVKAGEIVSGNPASNIGFRRILNP